MSDANKILAFIRSETQFSGVARYPIEIEEMASELSINHATVLKELEALKNQGIVEFCGLGNASVRLRVR